MYDFDRTLSSVGMRQFANCFESLEKYSKGILSREDTIESLTRESSGGIANNSAISKSYHGKRIFENNDQYKALKKIVNACRVDLCARNRAEEILRERKVF